MGFEPDVPAGQALSSRVISYMTGPSPFEAFRVWVRSRERHGWQLMLVGGEEGGRREGGTDAKKP